MKDQFLNQVRSMYFTHPKRPKLNTIGINCVPRRLTWQGLQAVALLTEGKFRPVCLEQAALDPVLTRPHPTSGDGVILSSFDLAPATSGGAGAPSDEDELDDSDN